MTTIAADHNRMVSDSKVTMVGVGGDRIYQAQKIQLHKSGDIVGGAGLNEHIEAFMEWYGTKKKKPKFPENADFEALVLTKDGRLIFYDETLSRDVLKNDFYAIGSGGGAAMGALYAGTTLETAVEIACRVDPHSGLPLQVLNRT